MKIVDDKETTCCDSNGKEVKFGEVYDSDCNKCLCGMGCILKACNDNLGLGSLAIFYKLEFSRIFLDFNAIYM